MNLVELGVYDENPRKVFVPKDKWQRMTQDEKRQVLRHNAYVDVHRDGEYDPDAFDNAPVMFNGESVWDLDDMIENYDATHFRSWDSL
jgi:hypothetical protein